MDESEIVHKQTICNTFFRLNETIQPQKHPERYDVDLRTQCTLGKKC